MLCILRLISFILCFSLALCVRANGYNGDNIKLEFPVNSQIISLPVPQKILSLNNIFTLRGEDEIIDAKFSYALLWPKLKSNHTYVRVLNIELAKPISSKRLLTLEWEASAAQLQPSSRDIQLNASLIYPSLSWLRKALLLTDNKGVDDTWYRQNQTLIAKFLSDETLLAKKGYPKNIASQWLYDRAQSFFQLFLSNGDPAIKRQADRIVRFYLGQINDDGFFKLSKPDDIKYLMGRSLVYDYLLNQREVSKVKLEKMFNASLRWSAEYSGRGFWTERHHAAALNIAISFWELSGQNTARERIDNLINGISKMTFSPINGWKNQHCPQHTFRSHEGWGDETPACSPWMMALLADNLWRYYLLTSDEKARKLLVEFPKFVVKKGVYYANEGKIKGHLIPKYLVSLNNSNQEELEPWSDREHTCDVASMVGKGLYLSNFSEQRLSDELLLFERLSGHCKAKSLAVIEKYKYVKLKYLTSKPPRKFNWEYSSTDDLPWLMSILSTPKLSD